MERRFFFHWMPAFVVTGLACLPACLAYHRIRISYSRQILFAGFVSWILAAMQVLELKQGVLFIIVLLLLFYTGSQPAYLLHEMNKYPLLLVGVLTKSPGRLWKLRLPTCQSGFLKWYLARGWMLLYVCVLPMEPSSEIWNLGIWWQKKLQIEEDLSHQSNSTI